MNLNTCFLYSSNNNFLAALYLSVFLSPLKCILKINSCNQEGSWYNRGGLAVTASLGVLPHGASGSAGAKGGCPFDERCCVLGLELIGTKISELH